MSGNSTLFTTDLPKILPMSKLYDPDVDVSSSVNTTKFIPAVNSLLVDDVYIYIVTSVDEVTGKSTYRPLSVIDSNATKRILEYGNSFYALFFAPVQITDNNGNKLQLTRLNVDDKLTFFGDSVTNYVIVKTSATGVESIISQYFDETNTNTGRTCKVAGSTDAKKCVPCYSYDELVAGETYILKAYDAAGNIVSEFKLIGVEASMLSVDIDENPIIDFYVKANQFASIDGLGTNAVFLYQGQDVKELTIYPYIKYADGTEESIVIDGKHGFIYGLEEIKTDIVGSVYNVLIKYAIGSDTLASNVSGYGENRYLSCSFDVHIIDRNIKEVSKIQIVPEFNINTNVWTLASVTYFTDRNVAPVITPVANATNFVGSDTRFNMTQNITVESSIVNSDGSKANGVNEYKIEVRDNPDNRIDPFLISDSEADDRIFGLNRAPNNIPPQIYYGINPANNMSGYFIPANTYVSPNFNDKVSCFLYNFYDCANPPIVGEEGSAPRPTHFNIRVVGSSRLLMTNPVAIEDFENILPLLTTLPDTPDQWVGSTVIVEFWKANENNFDILYGVPVRIRRFSN